MKPAFDLYRFWIRKDREQYLTAGLIITSVILSYVMGHWHFADTINAYKSMRTFTQDTAKSQAGKIQTEVEYAPAKTKTGSRQYYQIDKKARPLIPRLDEGESEPGNP